MVAPSSSGASAAKATTKQPAAAAASAAAGGSNKGLAPSSHNDSSSNVFLFNAVWWGCVAYAAYTACRTAYEIRLGAIREYGPVIHEFDPYFNYRATEYLYWNGWKRFFQWFDFTVWYPLGRPVGTTIYPGMQFTAVWIKRYIFGEGDKAMSLNDVCCYVPAWFGVTATVITGLIAYECAVPANANENVYSYLFEKETQTQNQARTAGPAGTASWWSPAVECGVAASAMMAIVPAHLMRSVGGGYDNESIAVTAMVLTFYFWTRSLRSTNGVASTVLFAAGTGLAYFYMVAAWGGYVFVLNVIGVHAAVLVLLGRFSRKVHLAYSLFYVIGTALAVQVPVVGWAPLKSLEQLGPCAVFFGYQLVWLTEVAISRNRAAATRSGGRPYTWSQAWLLRVQVFGIAAVAAVLAAMLVLPAGYFGPISARVRGLFVQHTKTGNPLVDSVAEHQPASNRAYFQYLHHACSLAPVGYLAVALLHLSDASLFLLVWGGAAYFFSHKMVRLILLTAPIACILGGTAAGRILAWCVQQWWTTATSDTTTHDGPSAAATGAGSSAVDAAAAAALEAEEDEANGSGARGGKGDGKKKKKGPKKAHVPSSSSSSSSFEGLESLQSAFDAFLKSKEGVVTKRTLSFLLIVVAYFVGNSFVNYCRRLSVDLSNPTIIQKARTRDGQIIKLDDYREAYWWLRDNTPEDSRIMAWWDYGYQISAIANRTTLADGNTWNHEHIALLGKALTSDLEEGWEIARNMADYVLIWGGGGGDDLAKSPHLARIANSVYRDHCPEDPTCRAFGFLDRSGTPSTMMRRSLLYRLHGHGLRPEVNVPEDRFQEVFRSKYGKVRIYKIIGVSEESKKWVLDNRGCDAPGSWFCPGKYPPALKPFIDARTDFRQLEDFNKGGKADDEYQKKYFEDLQNPESAHKKIMENEQRELMKQKEKPMTETEKEDQARIKERLYNNWQDSDTATHLWNLINDNNIPELQRLLDAEPSLAYVRSKDGRGPMFWAFEKRNEEITKILMKAGVPHTDKDAKGFTPQDLLEGVK